MGNATSQKDGSHSHGQSHANSGGPGSVSGKPNSHGHHRISPRGQQQQHGHHSQHAQHQHHVAYGGYPMNPQNGNAPTNTNNSVNTNGVGNINVSNNAQAHVNHHSGGSHQYHPKRTNSDASMGSSTHIPPHIANNHNHGPVPNRSSTNSANNININNNLDLLSLDDDTVPTVFRWEHGGRQVYITGTFNDWSRQIPMHRSGNDFTYIHNLKRGKHAFKFIVDDEWRFAPDQPTISDVEGRINNFIDVSDFVPYTGDRNFEERDEIYAAATIAACTANNNNNTSTENNQTSSVSAPNDPGTQSTTGMADPQQQAAGTSTGAGTGTPATTSTDPKALIVDEEGFSNNMPDLDEYTKEPPPLPPHLRHIILNKPPQLSDTAALPVPQHVALNHLYCTAIKDNMMVLGITQRFKTKFVTTVYYSPCNG